MQSPSVFFQNALKQGSVLNPKARIIAEWNHNRYTKVSEIDNFGNPEADGGFDLAMFPIRTIIDPLRPTAGLMKARAGEGVVVQGYSDRPGTYRTYTSDTRAKYKYWTGPSESQAIVYPSGGGYGFSELIQPYIKYQSDVLTNKIYVCFENSWTNPKIYDIQITVNGTTWTTIASDVVPDSKGRVVLYRQSGGNWTSTVNRDYATNIRGIRLLIKSVVKSRSWFNLIELGARLEHDLSTYLIDYSVKNDMSEADFVSPLGTISSNTASVTLSNTTGIFNNDNVSSPYYGILDANVKITIDFGIDVSNWGGSGYEYVTQATMYTDAPWGGGIESVELSLKDASKFLQDMKTNSELYENMSVGKVIWQILDSVGFLDYDYDPSDDAPSTAIPYFWTDEDSTVWDTIQELCRTTQTAAYFDEFGILQLKVRTDAFSTTSTSSWTLDYAQDGTKKPDIIDLNVNDHFEANKVTVRYQKTNLAQDSLGRPISEIVWQPEDTVVLRSSSLVSDMTSSQMVFWIDQKDVSTWPFAGFVNIQGELIQYKGKGYRYYPKGGAYTGNVFNDTIFKVIFSTDEKNKIDRELSSVDHGWRNYFTGYMRVEQRGYDITNPEAHSAKAQTPWLNQGSYYGGAGGTQKLWNGGTTFQPSNGIMRLQTNKTFKGDRWYTARRGNFLNPRPRFIGTRMKFPSNPKGKDQAAGIWFWGNAAQNNMYAVDIQRTATVNRTVNNEIRVMKRKDGVVTHIGGKGATFAIDFDKWYDIDVLMSGDASFTVSVNGNVVLRVIDQGIDLPQSGAAGLYVRGFTVADFEYFYMMGPNGIDESELDDASYLDMIRGGYQSNQYYRDFVTRTRKWYPIRAYHRANRYKTAYTDKIFDEFGAQVHEYRPYDIKFEKKPVLYSSLYFSNQDQAVVDEYIHSPFGAQFVIANASRLNSVVNGEDTLTYGVNNPVDQKMMITGRTVQQADPKDYVVRDSEAIRARGEISLEIDSQWIQSEAAAKALGDWIVTQWAEPADQIEVESFGNPLLQIGDIVSVNYPPRNMTAATHKYFIIGINQNWDRGLTTTLSLRRRN